MPTDTAAENPIINSPFIAPQHHWDSKKVEGLPVAVKVHGLVISTALQYH